MSSLDPKHYEQYSILQKTIAIELLEKYPIFENDIVLDIGCGDGYITSLLSMQAKNGKVIGIDPSTTMINHANRTYPSVEYPNLEFMIQSAESFPSQNQFSLITAFNSLHWCRDLSLSFKVSFNALRQNGRFIGLTYPRESIYWTPFLAVLSQKKWRKYQAISPLYNGLESLDYQSLAITSGFNIEYFTHENCSALYENEDDLKNYIKGWLPCLLPIDKNLQILFLNEVIAKMKLEFGHQNSFQIPYTKLMFVFSK